MIQFDDHLLSGFNVLDGLRLNGLVLLVLVLLVDLDWIDEQGVFGDGRSLFLDALLLIFRIQQLQHGIFLFHFLINVVVFDLIPRLSARSQVSFKVVVICITMIKRTCS